jgi:hypothetical protein
VDFGKVTAWIGFSEIGSSEFEECYCLDGFLRNRQ